MKLKKRVSLVLLVLFVLFVITNLTNLTYLACLLMKSKEQKKGWISFDVSVIIHGRLKNMDFT